MKTLPRRDRRTHPDQSAIPVASVVPAGSHLTGRTSDRVVGFDDVDTDDFHMPEGWVPARGADQLRHSAIPGVLAELRTADARLGMRPPAAPPWRPDRETVLRLMRVHARQTRIHAARYDAVADAVADALTELAALAPIAAMLAEVTV